MKTSKVKIRVEDFLYYVSCEGIGNVLILKNVDVNTALVLFIIEGFGTNEDLDIVEVDIDTDINFWKDYIKFMSNIDGKDRQVVFTGRNKKLISFKILQDYLLYSGGRDSYYSSVLRSDLKKLYLKNFQRTFIDIKYDECSVENLSEIILNQYNSIAGLNEMAFPLISPYKGSYLGIEKDVWFNDSGYMGNIPGFQNLLIKYGLLYDSVIKDLYSWEIEDKIKGQGIIRCNKSSFNWCYKPNCTKCAEAYLFNYTTFDSNKYKKLNKQYFDFSNRINFIKDVFDEDVRELKLFLLKERFGNDFNK